MPFHETELKIVRKAFENTKLQQQIRLGNHFVDDFIFDDHQAADIPINALRVIFNIISILSSVQFRPEDHPKQLSLFDQEFETQNNVFASMRIKNNKISPSGSTRQVIEVYEFYLSELRSCLIRKSTHVKTESKHLSDRVNRSIPIYENTEKLKK